MVRRENLEELEFTHFVVVSNERITLGWAKENGTGRTHLYLIEYEGSAVKRNHLEQWHDLPADEAHTVRQRARDYYGRVPVRRVPRLIL